MLAPEIGRPIQLIIDNEVHAGTIIGINKNGSIKVRAYVKTADNIYDNVCHYSRTREQQICWRNLPCNETLFLR